MYFFCITSFIAKAFSTLDECTKAKLYLYAAMLQSKDDIVEKDMDACHSGKYL